MPYLSFVVAARNDSYGGDFLHRMQVFLNVLLGWWRSSDLDAELVIVEWNPPGGRPFLGEALTWSSGVPAGAVRIVQVPPTTHQRLPNADRVPMFEYLAKNVGIRRARGEFVLATNPDLVFTQELVRELASDRLDPRRFYRIDRYDFRGPVPLRMSPAEATQLAKSRVFQLHTRGGDPWGFRLRIGRGRLWYARITGRWPHSRYDGERTEGSLVVSLKDDHRASGGIHANASGDFLLASRESWWRVRGFPERTDTYTHLDSCACYQLKALGLEQALFLPPCMILHHDHSRDEQASRPQVPDVSLRTELQRLMERSGDPAINSPGWGLAESLLPEFVWSGSEWVFQRGTGAASPAS